MKPSPQLHLLRATLGCGQEGWGPLEGGKSPSELYRALMVSTQANVCKIRKGKPAQGVSAHRLSGGSQRDVKRPATPWLPSPV